MEAHEGIQDALTVSYGDAFSVVDHAEDCAVLAAVTGDVDDRRDARAPVGHGVVDQILKQYPRLDGVRGECQVAAVDRRSGTIQGNCQILHHVLDQLGEEDPLRVEASAGCCEGEDLLDHGQHSSSRVADNPQVLRGRSAEACFDVHFA